MRAYLLVRHRIQEWSRFNKAFEESEDRRREYGLMAGTITRNAERPDEVIVLIQCRDLEMAKEFMKSDYMKQAMEKAGLTDAPDIYYLEEVADVPEPVAGQVEI